MLQSRTFRYRLAVLVVALVAAYISAKPLAQANALVVLPWGVLAFLTAFLARTKKEALVLGACFGFTVSYAYLWFNDTSKYTLLKVLFLVALIILPSLFGLLCGLLVAWLGWVTRSHMRLNATDTKKSR